MLYSELTLNEKRIFRVAVVATMSSGKSTLINALAGRELLPSINQACTARTLALLDNDRLESPVGHILYADSTYEKVDGCGIDTIRAFNSNEGKPISDIIVECDIEGVRNAQTALLLVDTPGINNDLDAEHGATTKSFLQQEMDEGLILFVLNATQLTTYDTSEFLRYTHSLVEKHPSLSTLFVINRMDSIDFDRESPQSVIETAVAMLENTGFDSASIIPVSAKAALLFKKALAGAALSEDEEDVFPLFFRKYTRRAEHGADCRDLVWNGALYKAPEVTVCGRPYSVQDLYRALAQTGVPTLEEYIEDAMLVAAGSRSPIVRKVQKGSGPWQAASAGAAITPLAGLPAALSFVFAKKAADSRRSAKPESSKKDQ